MRIFALLISLPIFVQALPTEYERAVFPRALRGKAKAPAKNTVTDKDFFLSCPGAAGARRIVCQSSSILNFLQDRQMSNERTDVPCCAGGTTPTSVTLGGSTSVSTTTSVNMNFGISFEGISIGGGMSTSNTKTTETTKSITYTVPPGRQAILTAGFKFHSQTGNVQVNYGNRVNGHFIVSSDAA
ncbi:hypothetical protein C0991_005831 [Blastosporella zonata]|nr:hypothetical protein C0991_005831 [Blastosporella zonata]